MLVTLHSVQRPPSAKSNDGLVMHRGHVFAVHQIVSYTSMIIFPGRGQGTAWQERDLGSTGGPTASTLPLKVGPLPDPPPPRSPAGPRLLPLTVDKPPYLRAPGDGFETAAIDGALFAPVHRSRISPSHKLCVLYLAAACLCGSPGPDCISSTTSRIPPGPAP